jgi:hypothetical protein
MFDVTPLDHPLGTLDLETASPVRIDRPAEAPCPLPKAEIHAALFEVPYAQAIRLLPPSLHPSTPAYATLSFYRVPDSEIGAFEFAVMGVACRSGIRPRMLTLSAFASTDAAVALLARWGFAARKAGVRTRFHYDAVRSEIFTDAGTIVEAVTMNPEILLGSARAIRYPQALNLAQRDGRDGLMQFDIAFEYNETYRGVLTLPVFDADAMTGGLLRPTDMIAGTYARLDATLMPVKAFLDTREIGTLIRPTALDMSVPVKHCQAMSEEN